MKAAIYRQRGVSLVTAIFLLVVLAGLAVGIVTVTTTQQAGAALDVQGTRAYLAARAGIEWGLFRQLRTANGWCPSGTGSSNTSSFALPSGSTLSSFSVSVTCTSTLTGSIWRYRIRSVACNQPASSGTACPNPSNSPDYVQRVIQIDFGS